MNVIVLSDYSNETIMQSLSLGHGTARTKSPEVLAQNARPVQFECCRESLKKSLFRRGVAQPGSALAWGARGRRFKSYRPDQT